MIKVIYGAKGTGKTKMMIDAANETVKVAKGHMIFITDSKRGMYDLEREVRFIDTSDYDVAGEAALCGFVKGVIAGNNDNEYVFIDGVVRIAGKPVQEMAAFFYMLEKVAKDSGITVTVSVSATKEELPDFVTKYLDA
jgi:chromosomal replication initiation ATPase DnaA